MKEPPSKRINSLAALQAIPDRLLFTEVRTQFEEAYNCAPGQYRARSLCQGKRSKLGPPLAEELPTVEHLADTCVRCGFDEVRVLWLTVHAPCDAPFFLKDGALVFLCLSCGHCQTYSGRYLGCR